MTARCDLCGRFVGSDALVVSGFIPPPREGMEDTVYCPHCAPIRPDPDARCPRCQRLYDCCGRVFCRNCEEP